MCGSHPKPLKREVYDMTMTLQQVREALKRNSGKLAREYKARLVGIFGSYVRGDNGPQSDVDILVEFKEPVSLLRVVSLENFLSDCIGTRVDLVPVEDLRPELKERVLKEAVSI
jgi:predicted nucleotidyltransferase